MKKSILLTIGIITIVFTLSLGITILEVRYLEIQKNYQRLKDSLSRFNQEYIQLKEELRNSKSSNFRLISDLSKEKVFRILEVEVTAYEPVKSQTDNSPHITASGKRITEEDIKGLRIAAVSRNLLKKFNSEAPFNFGDPIWIPFIIEDTMNKRYIDSVDLLMEEGRAKDFGRQQRSIIFIDK